MAEVKTVVTICRMEVRIIPIVPVVNQELIFFMIGVRGVNIAGNNAQYNM
jgi:hypothetical protein